jgi:methanogenic corrinoid protein MtbC1
MSPNHGSLQHTKTSQPAAGRLNDLASKALSEVAARLGTRGFANMSNTPLVCRMLEAAMDRSDETARKAAEDLLQAGIPPEVMVDDIIPKAARIMGEEWVQDISSFASVTLGASRLQMLVREIGELWSADDTGLARSAVLLWVPPSAQHTLGATIVSTKLRRLGHSVHFTPRDTDSLPTVLGRGTFDALVISASVSESLEDVGKAVEQAKSFDPSLPVIVGGTILKQRPNLVQITGANVATNDIDEAASHFEVAK